MAPKRSPHFFRGGVATFFILGVVFMGALTITGGLLPSKRKPPPLSYKTGELDMLPGSSAQYNLQLNTLKFKNVTPPALPTTMPLVTATPTPPIIPLPTVPCEQALTLDFLLDKSGSMGSLTASGVSKIKRLKEAVLFLSSKLGPNSIIGVQSFNKRDCNPFEKCPYGIKEDIPISYYKDVSSIFSSKINGLIVGGSTPTNDGLNFALEKLKAAQIKFAERKFKFILISDGQPVPSSQDPYVNNPNPVTDIKNLGIEIYTIAIYDSTQANTPNSPLKRLMQKIASKPDNFYEADSADQLKGLFDELFKEICI